MTDTNEAVITEALAVIDKALGQMMSRELGFSYVDIQETV